MFNSVACEARKANLSVSGEICSFVFYTETSMPTQGQQTYTPALQQNLESSLNIEFIEVSSDKSTLFDARVS